VTTNELDADDVVVKRFPRSTREAFADERGQWLELPPEHESLAPLWACLLACVVMVAVFALGFL
jgi:hypothetical protein